VKGNVAEGLTGLNKDDAVTLTYSGRLKVKSVTATTDAAAPAAPTPTLTYPIDLSEVTSDYIGSVMTTDGNLYATVADATAASKTPAAIIAYVGEAGSVDSNSDTYKCLAIALSDTSNGDNNTYIWTNTDDYKDYCLSISIEPSDKNGISCTSTLTGGDHSSHGHEAAAAAASNNGIAAPTGSSGWFLPSMGQWNLIVQGLATKKAGSAVTTDLRKNGENDTYKKSNLNSVITAAGGTAFNNYYWSSTEDQWYSAWTMDFNNGCYTDVGKSLYQWVRAAIAF
jgi:hypothetical protein